MINNLDQYNFIDIHYHANPDLYRRRHNVMEVGKIYQQLGGAVVIKSHLGSTSIQATIAQHEGLPVFPSLVLNDIAGGLNYKTILRALAEYQPIIPSKLIVHLPTITGRKHRSSLSRKLCYQHLASASCHPELISYHGKLKSSIIDIFKLSHDYPIVISTGHASKEETLSLIDVCNELDVKMLLLNQPANPLTALKADDLKEITKCPFVWVEQTALTYLLSYQNETDFQSVLSTVSNVIYSSDLGQTSQMDVPEWVESSNQWFSKFNISISRKAELCLINPLQILKI